MGCMDAYARSPLFTNNARHFQLPPFTLPNDVLQVGPYVVVLRAQRNVWSFLGGPFVAGEISWFPRGAVVGRFCTSW